MVFQADDFFLNVTAVDQKRGFLERPLLVGAGAEQFLQARLKPFHIALQHRAPVELHGCDGFAQVDHALAKLALDASAFLLAHLIQAVEHLASPSHHRRLERSLFRVARRIKRAGNAQDDVEIGLGRNAKLTGRRSKRRDVSAYQRTIQGKSFTASALQAERYLDVSTGNFLFEQAAKLHFERVRA